MSTADWFSQVAGTETGARLAMVLALISAIFHAAFGAFQKGRYDPWLIRGAIDVSLFCMALPLALFVFPLPDARLWVILIGVFAIHALYKVFLAMAYSRGDFTAVYPVVRGTGPLATILFAGFVFGERFTAMQWLGVACLSGGIFMLAIYNVTRANIDRSVLLAGIGFAVATGICVAVYTTYDAYGIRLTPNPFTFLAWFFVVDSVLFPVISYRLWRRYPDPPPLWPLLQRGFLAAFFAMISFGGVMLATRLDKVGEAAVLRETSVIFAALIGWVILKEPMGPRRLGIIGVIALGAVVVEFGA